jgi:phosphoglycerate dehydrogenase-like enzyme
MEVDAVRARSASATMPTAGRAAYRVALTADFFDGDGQLRYRDIGCDLLAAEPQLSQSRFAEHATEIAPEQLADCHASIVLSPRVTARSLAASENFLAIGRFGVGFDSVDVAACTAKDVALFITAGAVDWSVAEATVGWMLSLAHKAAIKDRLVRENRWDERSKYMGSELRERTLGIIGFGGIGRTTAKLIAGFGMHPPLVFDPLVTAEQAAQQGARSVGLDELLRESDFVSLHCPLNDKTRGLLGARELGLMKPTAYLLNTARGGIVDEAALYAALSEGRIAGAAIDCFAVEPPREPPIFAKLDNVLLAPHAIAWTDELFRDIGRTAWRGMIELSHGRKPHGVVNQEVFERPGFRAKWERILGRPVAPA